MAVMGERVAAPPREIRPGVVLAVCCFGLFLVTMDVTIVNVALPAIGRDLHATIAGLQWCIDGYAIVYGSLLMLAGSLADRFGRRVVFQAGFALFAFGSLLCALAPTISMLIVARLVQAAGGALLNPAAMAILSHVYADPKARARAIGIWGMMTGLSMAAGPVLGGILTESFGWPAIFAVNLPVCLLAMLCTAIFVPESHSGAARAFDPAGQSAIIVTLAALVAILIEGPQRGWATPPILLLGALAVLAFGALLFAESRSTEPLIELRFFRNRSFTAATIIAILVFAAFNAFLFFNAFYLESVRGLSAAWAGPCLLPAALAIIIAAPLSGRLTAAGHASWALTIAGGAIAAGAALLLGLRADTIYPLLFAAYALFGLGLGLANTPITNTAVAGLPRHQAGLAAGLASTSRVIGAAIGVALAGSTAAGSMTGHSLEAASVQAAALAQPLWMLLIACGLAVAALGLISRQPRA